MHILPIQKTSQNLSDILHPQPKNKIFYTNLSTLFTTKHDSNQIPTQQTNPSISPKTFPYAFVPDHVFPSDYFPFSVPLLLLQDGRLISGTCLYNGTWFQDKEELPTRGLCLVCHCFPGFAEPNAFTCSVIDCPWEDYHKRFPGCTPIYADRDCCPIGWECGRAAINV